MSDTLSRRELLVAGGAAAGLLALPHLAAAAVTPVATQTVAPPALAFGLEGTWAKGQYTLPPLPYAYDALAPLYEERTLRLHHDKHHAAAVKDLNKALQELGRARDVADYDRVRALSRDLACDGSSHVLHSLFWRSMAPGGVRPEQAFTAAMSESFGSLERGAAQLAAASKAVEASGWGLLVWEPMAERLLVLQAERHEDLTLWGVVPLLVCDVWEHAYYLQYQDDRGAWVDAFMKLANWGFAAKRLAQARGR